MPSQKSKFLFQVKDLLFLYQWCLLSISKPFPSVDPWEKQAQLAGSLTDAFPLRSLRDRVWFPRNWGQHELGRTTQDSRGGRGSLREACDFSTLTLLLSSAPPRAPSWRSLHFWFVHWGSTMGSATGSAGRHTARSAVLRIPWHPLLANKGNPRLERENQTCEFSLPWLREGTAG